jgi:peptidoglycan/xylan/chitin deacetylase (PgdA/CDA1 family)
MFRRLIFFVVASAFSLAIVAPPPSWTAELVPALRTPAPPQITLRRVIAAPAPTPTPDRAESFFVTPTTGVAVTFDDGPDPNTTPRIMDILEQHGVRGTFFVIGRQAAKYPDLVRSIVARGHIVAGHTWGHRNLTRLSEAGWRNEIDRTNKFLEELTGKRVHCVRPPGGRVDGEVVAKLRQEGLGMVKWTIDTRDWTEPGVGTIVGRATAGLRPGAVILLHDGGGNRDQTVQALEPILHTILGSGLEVQPIC